MNEVNKGTSELGQLEQYIAENNMQINRMAELNSELNSLLNRIYDDYDRIGIDHLPTTEAEKMNSDIKDQKEPVTIMDKFALSVRLLTGQISSLISIENKVKGLEDRISKF